MSTSYNTRCCIENLIEELEGYIYQLKDCLLLIDFAEDSSRIEAIRKKVKEVKERAKNWM